MPSALPETEPDRNTTSAVGRSFALKWRNFGLDEVRQARRNGENRTIGHGGDFAHPAVMVADKTEV
ncbi:hypothetical protein [Nitrospira sp. BLG_2]|uniref:hypothetical protein n=1 Tax=Nitrospira sp. BLG_2 TaxID=3397507 RepID=UPI003B9B5038